MKNFIEYMLISMQIYRFKAGIYITETETEIDFKALVAGTYILATSLPMNSQELFRI